MQKYLCIVLAAFLQSVLTFSWVLWFVFRPVPLNLPPPIGSQKFLINFVCQPINTHRIFRLQRIDPIAYEIAKRLSKHPLLQLHHVRFAVSCRPNVVDRRALVEFYDGRISNTILFSPFVLRDRHFKAFAAHELAHIKRGHHEDTDLNDYFADELAEKILTPEAIIDWREEDGPPPPIVLLEDPE